MRVLVVNAGSSSLKLRVVGDDAAVAGSADLPALDPGDATAAAALRERVGEMGPVDAVGHRVVHGGMEFREPTEIDDHVAARLASLGELAPLHQPRTLAAMDVVRAMLPALRHVACFDTAFHATIPDAAAAYALPNAWRERWPLRRFGFHGLSHAYAARRAAEILDRPLGDLQLVTAHLGAGASLAAVRDGLSADTTMGFTPLEGLVMATRSGSVDPGLVLWLQQQAGLSVAAVAEGLERQSGILGLGGTADMRDLLVAAEAGSPAASLARDVYVHRLRAGVGAMAAALDRLDALVFTGGVGENAHQIRRRAVHGLLPLGSRSDLDSARNDGGRGDRRVDPGDGPVAVLVVESREDLEIDRQVRRVLGGRTPVPPAT